MSQHVPPDPGLTDVESALGSLAPARSGLDRDRLMFLAGHRSARPPGSARWAWPALAAMLGALALGEGALLARSPRVVERVVVVREPTPRAAPAVEILAQPERPGPREEPPAESLALGSDSERLRRQILRYGLDAIPEPPSPGPGTGPLPPATKPETSGELLRSELARLINPGEAS